MTVILGPVGSQGPSPLHCIMIDTVCVSSSCVQDFLNEVLCAVCLSMTI